jgi:hypothetical protein
MASTSYFGIKNVTNNSNYPPLILNKVTLRYQDGGKIRDDPTSIYNDDENNVDDDIDDERLYHSQINEQYAMQFNEPFYFHDENHSKTTFNNKKQKKGNEIDKLFSIEKSLNRLSLLKFRENSQNLASQNDDASNKKFNKKSIKVNTIVSEIVPLITNRESTTLYNDYFDQEATFVQNQAAAPILPKVARTQSFQQSKSRWSQSPSATPVMQSLPRPNTNSITNKNKVFDLVYGINSKFMKKYLPSEKAKKNSSLYTNEKLPGNLALYKLMSETSKTNLNSASSMELDRIRKEILSRNSLNQGNFEEMPRMENISPNNFTFNKITIKRNLTIHEINRRSIPNFVSSNNAQSQSPTLSIVSSQLKNPESVMAYLSHLKTGK